MTDFKKTIRYDGHNPTCDHDGVPPAGLADDLLAQELWRFSQMRMFSPEDAVTLEEASRRLRELASRSPEAASPQYPFEVSAFVETLNERIVVGHATHAEKAQAAASYLEQHHGLTFPQIRDVRVAPTASAAPTPNDMKFDPTPEMSNAYNALRSIATDDQRARVLCWFCRGCSRYVGPGDACHCENDE